MTTTAQSVAAESIWSIDPIHSSVLFKVRHMMISNVRGDFKAIRGTLHLDEKDITRSYVAAEIEAASINTGDAQRDQHLRSADFLDVAQFPLVAFRSTNIRRVSVWELQVTGDLTIREVTRQIDLDVHVADLRVKDLAGNWRYGATATVILDRQDFGLVWNSPLETGGVLVGEQVTVELDIEFLEAKREPEKPS